MSDEHRITRTIGEPSLFSIRFQLDEHFGGERMYGRFSMNVMGNTLADGETLLGDLLTMLTDAARDNGNRGHAGLFRLEKEKLFDRLHDVFYEGNDAQLAEEEMWARFNIVILDETMSMKSMFVIAGKEYERLLIADYERKGEPGWRTEYMLPLGVFDGVIARACRELESLHEWKVRGSRGAMKVSDLETPPGFSPSEEHLKYGLPVWYAQVRVKRLDELTVEDLCRLLRQNMYMDELLPNVFEILTEDVFAGTLYRGELLRALSNLPAEFWETRDNERERWQPIIRELKQEIEDHLQAAERLLERME